MSLPWALLGYTIYPWYSQLIIRATTSIQCHLYCHTSLIAPTLSLLPVIRRGLPTNCFPSWYFRTDEITEQQEAGDTIVHTFNLTPWLSCTTRWYVLSRQTSLSVRDSTSPLLSYHNVCAAGPAIAAVNLCITVKQIDFAPLAGFSYLINGTLYNTDPVSAIDYSWGDLLKHLGATNPTTGVPWTWDDIAQMQMGPRLRRAACTYAAIEILMVPYTTLIPSANGGELSIPNEQPPGHPHYDACRTPGDSAWVYNPGGALLRDLYCFAP